MISLLIVTKNKYELLNNNLKSYVNYKNLDEILIFDNSLIDEKLNGNILVHEKIKIFNDINFTNVGLYGGLNKLMNVAKLKESEYFVILDDDAYVSEDNFINILNYQNELKSNIGVSMHLSYEDNETFTEPIYVKNGKKSILLYKTIDFDNCIKPVFVDSAPNIGIVISNHLMKMVSIPPSNLFFCGEAFMFHNFNKINARLFYMENFKVYHKKHTFSLIKIPIIKKTIKVSIVSDFHDYYEIRNYIRFIEYKKNYKSLFILPLLIGVKILKAEKKINKLIIIIKSLLNIKF
jgi:hypothetical protein